MELRSQPQVQVYTVSGALWVPSQVAKPFRFQIDDRRQFASASVVYLAIALGFWFADRSYFGDGTWADFSFTVHINLGFV